MRTYFVLANRTLFEEALEDAIRERMAQGPSRFHLIVPASPPPRQGFKSWTDGEAVAIARGRMDEMLERMRAFGAECDGEVGDAHPQLAVEDAIRSGREPDEIIVSTLPSGVSKWLRLDLMRLLSRYDVPVTHLVSQTDSEHARR
jgi:GABA permease